MTELTQEAIRRIRRLELKTTRRVNELFAGAWASCFKGRGIEFDDLREYQPGDPPRAIDWNVTARMQKPFIKQYREERELQVILMCDLSASTLFGAPKSKRELIAELSAILAFSAMKNHDKVGLFLFTDRLEKFLPAKRGISHGIRVIRDLLYFEPKGQKTDLRKALLTFGNLYKGRGALIFLFSDFLAPTAPNLFAPLINKHDLVAIDVQDPLETALPPTGLLHLQDLETQKEGYFNMRDPSALKKFQEESLSLKESHKRAILGSGGSFLDIKTDTSPIETLRRFLHSRRAR